MEAGTAVPLAGSLGRPDPFRIHCTSILCKFSTQIEISEIGGELLLYLNLKFTHA